jgi:membrane protein required for colicin V production
MGFSKMDIIFLILIAILMLRCLLRGFLREFMTWASLALGILAAVFFHRNGGIFLRERLSWDARVLPEIAAFLIIFLIIFFFIRFLELILKDIFVRIHLGGLDHFLGFLFGLLEGVVMVSFLLLVLSIQPLFDPGPLFEASMFARVLLPAIGDIHQNISSGSGAGV